MVSLGYVAGLFETIIYYFLTKMSYFISQEVENLVQVVKYDELSRFQLIIKLLSQFCWKFIHFKAAYW